MKDKVNLDLGSAIRENVHKSEKALKQLMLSLNSISFKYPNNWNANGDF